MSVAGALLLTLTLSAATAELKARPGGKIRIDYGAARWQEAWEERIFDQMIWRLSAASPNRAEIEPALLFDDTVVFPGTYNLGLVNRGPETWGLVFHDDGLNWNAGPCEAETRFPREWLPEEDLAEALSIDLSRGEEEGTYVWTIDLGPRHLQKSFRTADTRRVRGRVGRHPFTVTVMEREDLDAVREELVEDEVIIARIESDHLRRPARAHLRGGETTELVIWPGESFAAPTFLDGQRGTAQRPSKRTTLTIESGRDYATLEFVIGEETYVFDLPPEPFERGADDDEDDEDGD